MGTSLQWVGLVVNLKGEVPRSERLLHPIHREIQTNPAWFGRISGLVADKMLRNKKIPFLYILREGECDEGGRTNYYISFLLRDLSIRHHPFVIATTAEGWYYDDADTGGPFKDTSFENVLHLMMGCQQGDCVPFKNVNM